MLKFYRYHLSSINFVEDTHLSYSSFVPFFTCIIIQIFIVVGLQEGMKMMLSGSSVRPDKAKKIGLVDLVVDPASLEEVAITQVRGRGFQHRSNGSGTLHMK